MASTEPLCHCSVPPPAYGPPPVPYSCLAPSPPAAPLLEPPPSGYVPLARTYPPSDASSPSQPSRSPPAADEEDIARTVPYQVGFQYRHSHPSHVPLAPAAREEEQESASAGAPSSSRSSGPSDPMASQELLEERMRQRDAYWHHDWEYQMRHRSPPRYAVARSPPPPAPAPPVPYAAPPPRGSGYDVELVAHRCMQCAKPRSHGFHLENPIMPGSLPIEGICRRCHRANAEKLQMECEAMEGHTECVREKIYHRRTTVEEDLPVFGSGKTFRIEITSRGKGKGKSREDDPDEGRRGRRRHRSRSRVRRESSTRIALRDMQLDSGSLSPPPGLRRMKSRLLDHAADADRSKAATKRWTERHMYSAARSPSPPPVVHRRVLFRHTRAASPLREDSHVSRATIRHVSPPRANSPEEHRSSRFRHTEYRYDSPSPPPVPRNPRSRGRAPSPSDAERRLATHPMPFRPVHPDQRVFYRSEAPSPYVPASPRPRSAAAETASTHTPGPAMRGALSPGPSSGRQLRGILRSPPPPPHPSARSRRSPPPSPRSHASRGTTADYDWADHRSSTGRSQRRSADSMLVEVGGPRVQFVADPARRSQGRAPAPANPLSREEFWREKARRRREGLE